MDKSLAICPLASGSKGNAVYISAGKSAVLLDAGLSGIELERRMAEKGLSPDTLKGVVISHEHADHVKGAGVLSRRYHIPLYINEKTFQAATPKLGKVTQVTQFQCGRPFSIGELTVNPFSISHDAQDPSGFTFEHCACKLGVATDLGVATSLVKTHLRDSSLLYIEANHDPEMLHLGPYPWYLKQRVRSRRGHLSNQEAGALLGEVKNGGLKHVILAHLSEENNTPEKAWQTVSGMLGDPEVNVHVAMPDRPGELIHI